MYGLSIALVFGYSNNNDLPNCNSRNTSPDYYVHHDYRTPSMYHDSDHLDMTTQKVNNTLEPTITRGPIGVLLKTIMTSGVSFLSNQG